MRTLTHLTLCVSQWDRNPCERGGSRA